METIVFRRMAGKTSEGSAVARAVGAIRATAEDATVVRRLLNQGLC